MEFIKKIQNHPILYGICAFLFVFIPNIVPGWWSLLSDKPMIPTIAKWMGNMDVPDISIKWLYCVTAPLGLGMLGYIVYLAKKTRPKKRDYTTGILTEKRKELKEALESLGPPAVPSPLKIEVQEDGNSYLDIGFTDGLSLKDGQRCILGIKIHNTSNKSIDNVQVYINVLNAHFNQLRDKSLIYLHYTDTDESIVSFSPHQKRSVNVLSYLNARSSCEFSIEQFNVKQKPEIFITEQAPCKIEITVTGKGCCLNQQAFEVFMISEAQYDSLDSKRRRIFMKRISKEDQETIESPKERQRSKLKVTFEKGNKLCLQSMRFTSPISKRDGQLYTYRIRVKNTRSEIIKSVNVKLMEIKECPDDFFAERCYFQFMHEHDLGVKTKDIQPDDEEFVDIIGYFDPYNKDVKKKEMYILHTEREKLKSDIPVKKYDITIKINSDNGGSPITKHFRFTPRKNPKACMMEMIN